MISVSKLRIENAKSLVAKFLMMTVEELEEEDFKDAFGEVTNILGGQIRPLITEHHPGVTLGFPTVYQGVRFFLKPTRSCGNERDF